MSRKAPGAKSFVVLVAVVCVATPARAESFHRARPSRSDAGGGPAPAPSPSVDETPTILVTVGPAMPIILPHLLQVAVRQSPRSLGADRHRDRRGGSRGRVGRPGPAPRGEGDRNDHRRRQSAGCPRLSPSGVPVGRAERFMPIAGYGYGAESHRS